MPMADGTLVATPGAAGRVDGRRPADAVRRHGHRAPRRALGRRRPGSTVVVVGDGAVGLCAVIAAKRLGAERIIAMSRHADRQALARDFGATDVVAERGDDGVARVAGAARRRRRRRGARVRRHEGVDAAGAGRHPARRSGRVRRRPGRRFRAADPAAVLQQHRGGRRRRAGPRPTSPSCSTTCSSGAIDPGRVFDLELPLEQAPEAYAAMDERRSIKTMLRP